MASWGLVVKCCSVGHPFLDVSGRGMMHYRYWEQRSRPCRPKTLLDNVPGLAAHLAGLAGR
jgi:hypothetical protein